ncbi:MAG: RDD family protein [bacterium]
MNVKFAGFWIRAFASLLDLIIWCIFFFPTTYIVKGTWLMTKEDHLWGIFDPLCGMFLGIIFLYWIVLETFLGGTVGKLLLGLRVTNDEFSKISFEQSILRNGIRLIDGLPCFNLLGIFSIILSKEKQRIGDKVAKTFVVYKNSL